MYETALLKLWHRCQEVEFLNHTEVHGFVILKVFNL